MSAFVVSPMVIDHCVRAIAMRHRYEHERRTFAGLEVFDSRNWTKIGRKLLDLNVRAVAGRYRQDKPDLVDPETYNFGHNDFLQDLAAKCQALKHLQCLEYQCSEDATKGDPLLDELRAYIKTFTKEIVHALPEYEAAKWG
jgi:hypothetical protein